MKRKISELLKSVTTNGNTYSIAGDLCGQSVGYCLSASVSDAPMLKITSFFYILLPDLGCDS